MGWNTWYRLKTESGHSTIALHAGLVAVLSFTAAQGGMNLQCPVPRTALFGRLEFKSGVPTWRGDGSRHQDWGTGPGPAMAQYAPLQTDCARFASTGKAACTGAAPIWRTSRSASKATGPVQVGETLQLKGCVMGSSACWAGFHDGLINTESGKRPDADLKGSLPVGARQARQTGP